MGCPNIYSKDFKKLAAQNNVAADYLTQIIHQYWIETGSEEHFPTNIYIQNKLGNTQYQESSKTIQKLWQQNYSTPQRFDSAEERNQAKEEALQFFPPSAVVTYQDAEGQYVLTVKQPVNEINRDLQQILEQFDDFKSLLRKGYLQEKWPVENMGTEDMKSAIKDYINTQVTDRNKRAELSQLVEKATPEDISQGFRNIQQEIKDNNLILKEHIADLKKSGNFAEAEKLQQQITQVTPLSIQDFVSSDVQQAIQTGNWTSQTIEEFNNFINKVQNGEINFRRVVGERRAFTSGISEAHAGASLLLQGVYGTSEAKSRNPQTEYEREATQGKEQEKILEAWAKAEDLWLNDYTDEEGNKANSLEDLLHSQWEYADQGSEAEVYWFDDTQVLKSINLSHANDNIAKALDSIALFNQAFPLTAMQVMGFGRDSLGHFRMIVTQPRIKGKELTDAELEDFQNKYNITYENGWFHTEDGNILLTDLSPSNILKDEQGNYFVIDADVVYNTPARGGKTFFVNAFSNITEEESKKEESNNTSQEQSTQVQQNLTEYDILNTQIDNLLDSSEISASEVRHVAELIINSISDIISEIQRNPDKITELFPALKLKKDINFSDKSRKEIVEIIGINRLIEKAKENFDPEKANYTDINTILQADLIVNNWDAIMTLASDIFAANEGFGISKNYDTGNFQTVEEAEVDWDNFDNYRDSESIREMEGDEQEHWQVESRTVDILNSMSQLVRMAIHNCYQLDKKGNKVMSKWGIPERVNARTAVNSILRWTQGALTLEDMIAKLNDKQNSNPWLSQLIEKLSDTSGKETDFQSQFFGVFCKHFQPYSIVLAEDGKYHSIPVNSHPALTEAIQTISAQHTIGEHPLFTLQGINLKVLGNNNTTSSQHPFNLHKGLAELQIVVNSLNHGETLDAELTKKASDTIVDTCRVLGYPIEESLLEDVLNPENIKNFAKYLNFIVTSLDQAAKKQREDSSFNYRPFQYGTDHNIAGTLRNFLQPITEKLEDVAISAFYDSGKMYQSYVTPSFMTKLMNKFRLEGEELNQFIQEEYKSSEWFWQETEGWNRDTNSPNGIWLNEWLEKLSSDAEARKVFDHKVELNFNKHNYMRNMSDTEYTLSLIAEYFAESDHKAGDMAPAWFRIPMLSNKPSSEFIRFYSHRGDHYKENIINGFYKMFLQELRRIQTVKMRNLSKEDAGFIKNFDTNGRKFNFLPFLNKYLEDSQSLISKKIEGKTPLTTKEENDLRVQVLQTIEEELNRQTQKILDEWERTGIIEAAKNIEGIYPKGLEENQATAWTRQMLENFIWNDHYAAANILQLTITDIAFYKDAEDLQKRLAQIHAPGIRAYTAATDYQGNRVSDGKYRTFLLKDFDNFVSNIIENIAEVFDRKINRASEAEKPALQALKESLVGENGKYRNINVTDGQGYSSPSSYRKKALMFGKWSQQAETIYQNLKKGNYTFTDLETAFQPLKPFVYSKLHKNLGVSHAPIQNIPVPFQAKNSEYLLIMADAIIQGEEAQSGKLSRPNMLRAIYRVMEESERLSPTQGIDTVQFESSIKSGVQAPIDIQQFANTPGGEEAAFQLMMNSIYQKDAKGNRIALYNTDVFVHEAPYEDYCLQQEVPEHFKDHFQAHGSQIRMIIPSDLDDYKDPKGDTTAEENQVFYEWTEPDGTQRKVKAQEFRKEYERNIADNISESIDNLLAELHLQSEDRKERNIALSKILQREILSSPRYGVDLLQACSVDKETGEFRIPKGDPIQAKRIEQLINSIIKNRVNKQKIAGGPIVQVSNFGTSQQLHIRFKDKQGNLLPTEEEYNAQFSQNAQEAHSTHLPYKDFIQQNQAGIAYFEVFIPIWSNELFEKFANTDGTINVEAIEATDPELLKMVSYRIPTEDKYSCAPMKVVGFMPREAGDAIMLPQELTEIDDSDFDVDKRYVMRKDISIRRRSNKEIEQRLFEKVSQSYTEATGKKANKSIGEQVKMFMDNPEKMRHTSNLMETLYKEYQSLAYYTEPPTTGRKYRDNKIVDMTWAVLTNEMTADKILNPGGFDVPKRMGYMIAAYKNPANTGISWESLQHMTIDQLKDLSYTNKDLTWADTQVQFYRQNSAAASLIGVFAVNKVAHATLESNDILLDIEDIKPFTIMDTEFGGRKYIDRKYDKAGNLIGKTLGSLVSASADAVKDPVLNLMNVNMTTAGVLNTMLRLGMPFEEASLFLSQDIITRLLNEFNKQNLTNYEPLTNIIDKWLNAFKEKHEVSEEDVINQQPISQEELIEGLTHKRHEVIDYKVLSAFKKLRALTEAMRKPTFVTRFNSVSSAVGPQVIDNLITEYKMEKFKDINSDGGTGFYTSDGVNVDIDDIRFDHPILDQFARTIEIAKEMFSDMPSGSEHFRVVLQNLGILADRVYNDKKLLDNLANFYQSYLLIASGLINPKQLKEYIENFPKQFAKESIKQKYPDNLLIQAITVNANKKTGTPYLSINITGMDTQHKEELSNAWIDLHKNNPELSQKLFNYCFFRGGIGFTPKTFMALVPTYVKERITNTREDGTTISYTDTFRNLQTENMMPEVILDQWVANNWNNNKLVPKKGGKGTKYSVDLENGRLSAFTKQDVNDLRGNPYIKTKHNGQWYLWKLNAETEEELHYTRMAPLGNNGEYVEMSLTSEITPLKKTSTVEEDNTMSDLQTPSPAQTDAMEATPVTPSETQQNQKASEMVDLIMKQRPNISQKTAKDQFEKMKQNPQPYVGYIQNLFKHLGLDLDTETALKEFEKYC